jgi:hypothetical protein
MTLDFLPRFAAYPGQTVSHPELGTRMVEACRRRHLWQPLAVDVVPNEESVGCDGVGADQSIALFLGKLTNAASEVPA